MAFKHYFYTSYILQTSKREIGNVKSIMQSNTFSTFSTLNKYEEWIGWEERESLMHHHKTHFVMFTLPLDALCTLVKIRMLFIALFVFTTPCNVSYLYVYYKDPEYMIAVMIGIQPIYVYILVINIFSYKYFLLNSLHGLSKSILTIK